MDEDQDPRRFLGDRQKLDLFAGARTGKGMDLERGKFFTRLGPRKRRIVAGLGKTAQGQHNKSRGGEIGAG